MSLVIDVPEHYANLTKPQYMQARGRKIDFGVYSGDEATFEFDISALNLDIILKNDNALLDCYGAIPGFPTLKF